jgi:diguanylate cyclase (GGDEF)-like protein/PAS domain S-box-containing protein
VPTPNLPDRPPRQGAQPRAPRRELAFDADVFETLLENHFAGIVVYDTEGAAIWASEVALAMTGYTAEERLVRSSIFSLHPDDRDEARRRFAWLRAEPGRTVTLEHRVHHKDGRWIWVEAHLKNLLHEPKIQAIVSNFHDITDRVLALEALRESEQRQRDLAHRDHLTGLGNRRAFVDELERAAADLARGALADFAVCFLDLDGFKRVNDRLGHAFGDAFLRHTAERLRAALPAGDVVARIGGDEFAVVARSVRGLAQAEAYADRLVHTISDPVTIRGHLVQLPGCVGVVSAAGRGCAPLELLRYADTALYAAKQDGSGRVRRFDAALETQLRESSELAESFALALERRELDVHYQPIVDLADRRIVGFEALVRWNHPTRGLLPASAFVPAAEETGLVIPMGEWVFERVCADAARWTEAFGPHTPWVSVNLSSAQLIRRDFGDFVRRTVERHGIRPGQVRLELTETGLFETDGPWRDRLWEAEAAGVPLMLDDFGTGYTSIRYLAEFPIAVLKLDKTYVQRSTSADPDRRRRALSLIRAVGRMSRSLDLIVVAEGVETEAQHQAVVDAGCQLGQGWLYDRAMTPDDVGERLGRGPWVL